MPDDIAAQFIALQAERIRLMIRMEAARDGGAADPQPLMASIAAFVELARDHGRRKDDHDPFRIPTIT